jgi:hypothetical protein
MFETSFWVLNMEMASVTFKAYTNNASDKTRQGRSRHAILRGSAFFVVGF